MNSGPRLTTASALLLVGLGQLAGGGSLCRAESTPVGQWTIAEIALTSAAEYENPFADVSVTATFEHADARIERPAFWDGGPTWKIRFAPPKTGEWTWQTTCSDQADAGLHGRSGRLRCVPYEGANPNYRHGFIRVSPNRRYFVRADGTPFFWLGDTHWQMADWERLNENNAPDAAGRSQFHQLADDRAKKGFTVYQNYFAGHHRHWWRDDRYACIDPTRFREVLDPMLDHLAGRGFVIAQGMGLYVTSVILPRESLVRLAEYTAARYGAHPVVWFTAQEVNLPGKTEDGRPRTDLEAWHAAAAAFAEPEETVLATEEDRLAVVYAYGKRRELGSLLGMARAATYDAVWFDPRTGEYRDGSLLRTTEAGALVLPEKPDGSDWVLKLTRRQ
jgi:hypothetical protein